MRTAGRAGVALGAALVISGGGLLAHARGAATPSDVGVVPRASGATPTPGAPAPGSPPVAVRIPALGVEARVRPVVVGPDGALGVPDSPDVLGWWSAGARPGSGAGTVVVDGHVDSARYGLGALYRLGDVPMGGAVEVRTREGRWLGYRVVARRTYPKGKIPAGVFARSGRARLVLITCAGRFDRRVRHYSDNLVVYAVPAAGGARPVSTSGSGTSVKATPPGTKVPVG